jgi:hypothetical protein
MLANLSALSGVRQVRKQETEQEESVYKVSSIVGANHAHLPAMVRVRARGANGEEKWRFWKFKVKTRPRYKYILEYYEYVSMQSSRRSRIAGPWRFLRYSYTLSIIIIICYCLDA